MFFFKNYTINIKIDFDVSFKTLTFTEIKFKLTLN